MILNNAAPNPEYDNSDILAPASALSLMTDRVMGELQQRGVTVTSDAARNKNGTVVARVPHPFSKTQLRNTYQRLLRMLEFKETGAPSTPTIREEFEIAMVTAYRNNSHHVFYIDAMYRSFMENSMLETHKESVACELSLAKRHPSKENIQWGWIVAFDNALRFHPLYVAYLYGTSGDVERENKLITEAVDYMAWLFTRGA